MGLREIYASQHVMLHLNLLHNMQTHCHECNATKNTLNSRELDMHAEEVEMCYGLYHKEETELMTSFSKPLSS